MEERLSLIDQIINNFYQNQCSTHKTDSEEERSPSQQKIIIKKANNRQFNQLKLFKNLRCFHHVYKLFNTFGVNQNTLQNQEFQECFFRTHFYHKSISKVEKYQNAVVIWAIPTNQQLCQPDVLSFIEQMKSMKNPLCPKIAGIIQQILHLLSTKKKAPIESGISGENYSITKFLNSLKDSMFVCKFGLSKMAISNSLLEYLGINVEEFAVQTIKYRTVLFDFLSSSSYKDIFVHCMGYVKNLLAHAQNKVSQKQYNNSKQMFFSDFIYSKDNIRSYCDLQVNFPIPQILYIKVLKVHYHSNEIAWRRRGQFEGDYSNEKQRIHRQEFKLLHHLTNEQPQIKKKGTQVAGYQQIAPQNKQI